MLVLTIIAALALLFAVLEMTLNFGEHCQTKFGFKPMAAGTLCLWQLYAILFYGGWMWMANAAQAPRRHTERHARCWGWPLWRVLARGEQLPADQPALRRRHNGIADCAGRDPLFPPLSLFNLIELPVPSDAQRQRRDDNDAGLSGYR